MLLDYPREMLFLFNCITVTAAFVNSVIHLGGIALNLWHLCVLSRSTTGLVCVRTAWSSFYLSAHLLYIDKSYILFKRVCIILLHVTFCLVECDWDEWWERKKHDIPRGDLQLYNSFKENVTSVHVLKKSTRRACLCLFHIKYFPVLVALCFHSFSLSAMQTFFTISSNVCV
jgi:hypothetical protein